jgi:hypothetical protein
MWHGTRRDWLTTSAALAGSSLLTFERPANLRAQPATAIAGVRRSGGLEVMYPRNRVPLSFIIDDSTCLVNMGHFCTPQFHACYPDRAEYQKDWRAWPREIPDAFVREFGEWCAEHGVRGKYSVVPNPACVGWLDRELPGWSRAELLGSLKLVRESMLPNWDIHPEMITHTRVIDLKSGRPIEEISPATMENSYPRERKSVDELAEYLAYSLRILRNCELPCEGVTTPGGFGNLLKSELSLAVQQAVRDVFDAEIPHYFKYVIGGDESTEPKLEHVSGVGTDDLRLTVNVPAGTGDWFGGWQGDVPSQPDLYGNEDATSGRMVQLIERGQPALMLCHWPGIYSSGSKEGFHSFQRVVVALNRRFGARTQWMKLSEIARYWAAKELTNLERGPEGVAIDAPFACPEFTFRVATQVNVAPRLVAPSGITRLREVTEPRLLAAGTWLREANGIVACVDLPQGTATLQVGTVR